MKLKETVNNLVYVIGRILFGIVFLLGMVFVADQINALVGKSYAETPKIENLSDVVHPQYERVYAYGKYYLVFTARYGGHIDMEVIPLDN